MRPQQLSHEEWLRQRVQVALGIDIFLGHAAGIFQTFRRLASSVVAEDISFVDAEDFDAEGRLPCASIETLDGRTYIDPDTGFENQIRLNEEFLGSGIHEQDRNYESRYGAWSPGSSDTVGRKGPQWMADTEDGERIILEFRNM